MCGAVIPSNSLHGPPLGTPTYFPIYEAANELGCCVAIHGGVHGNMGMDGLDPYAAVHAIGHPLGQMISLASIVFNGVLERFPKIRFGFLEGGVAWFLFCLERFDSSYETHVMRDLRGQLSKTPSRRENQRLYHPPCQSAAESSSAAKAASRFSARRSRWSATSRSCILRDFPHEVNSETCRHELNELIENERLSDADKEAIFYKNAIQFYGL